jgi:electron transfer flavoprotein beta subunit
MITVLVGWYAHPVSGRPVRNTGDAVAASLALQLGDVWLLTAGDMPDTVARDYVALGARRIEILQTTAHDIAPLLAPALQSSALVLTGTRADAGLRSGALPYELASLLQRPLLPNVIELCNEDDAWHATQALPRGARRHLLVSVPAVITIHPAAPVALRHSYRDQQAGEVLRREFNARQAADSPWQLVPAAKQLQRLQAQRPQSGHDRMLGAIALEQGGGRVLRDGSAEDKARAILDHLQARSLLNT